MEIDLKKKNIGEKMNTRKEQDSVERENSETNVALLTLMQKLLDK